MIISDFPVMIAESAKFPDFEYTGEYSIIDDGSESGLKQVAFLSTGTLTLPDGAEDVTVQAQGGGGSGGAYNGTTKGSDGYDGSIDSYEGPLEEGTYSITIGAGGAVPYGAKGKSGGATSFGDTLSASGGAGGAYGGGVTRTHSGLYSTYGQGGKGGTTSQVTNTIQYYVSGAGATLYSSASESSATDLTLSSGKHKTNYGQNSSWYRISSGTYSGYYVKASDVTWTSEITKTEYRGVEGNPGIVILSGKV